MPLEKRAERVENLLVMVKDPEERFIMVKKDPGWKEGGRRWVVADRAPEYCTL